MPRKFLSQRGLAPVLVIIILGVLLVAGGALYFQSKKLDENTVVSTPAPTSTPQASSTPSPTPKPTLKPTIKPTTKPATPTSSPTSSSNSNNSSSYSQSTYSSSNPQPTSAPTPGPSVSCEVHSDKTSGSSPLSVTFYYGASFSVSNGDYVTNVQWDFNGDGSWDTSYDSSQQHPSPYTFSSPGNYTAKMHLQTLNGLESGVCSESITVN